MDKRYGILVICAAILVLCFVGTASAKTWYVDDDGGADFTGIQDAITAASAGDTIIVSDGNYTENVRVYKRLTIQSESGPDATIVQAAASEDPVFNVTAAYVEICGFTAKGADTGIYLCDADYCNISNNNCSNNGGGISLQDSNSNSISNNTCTSNNGDGIVLGSSNKNSISNNDCSNNDGFHSSGIYLGGSNNNNISNNNCTNSGKGGIYLVSSNNNSKVFVFRGDGIILSYSSKNSISNNNCTNNGEGGISFYESNNNSILNNNCDRISLFCLNYNLIDLNNFLKKTDNVFFMNQPTHGTPQKKLLTPTTKGHTRTT